MKTLRAFCRIRNARQDERNPYAAKKYTGFKVTWSRATQLPPSGDASTFISRRAGLQRQSSTTRAFAKEDLAETFKSTKGNKRLQARLRWFSCCERDATRKLTEGARCSAFWPFHTSPLISTDETRTRHEIATKMSRELNRTTLRANTVTVARLNCSFRASS